MVISDKCKSEESLIYFASLRYVQYDIWNVLTFARGLITKRLSVNGNIATHVSLEKRFKNTINRKLWIHISPVVTILCMSMEIDVSVTNSCIFTQDEYFLTWFNLPISISDPLCWFFTNHTSFATIMCWTFLTNTFLAITTRMNSNPDSLAWLVI